MNEHFGQPSGSKRFTFGAAALIISGVLHVVALQALPLLPTTGAAARSEELRGPDLLPTMKVEEVRMAELPDEVPYPEPDRFVPEDPNQVADVTRELEQTGTPPDAAPLNDPIEPSAGPKDTLGEVKPAALPEAAPTWQPRQEVLAVTEALYSEEISALPRQFTPDVPRSVNGADLTAPVESVDATKLLRMAEAARNPPPLATGPASLDRIYIPSDIASRSGPGTGAGIPPPGPMPPEDSGPGLLLEETPEEVIDLKPVENLLGIRVFTRLDEDDPNTRYFKTEIYRDGIEALPVLPKHVVFMLDCSESMTNAKLKRFREGLDRSLELLNPSDTFNIITFRDNVETCFPSLQPANATYKARARAFLQNLSARGKTDVYASLQKLAEMRPPDGYPLIALLMTDGRPTMGLMDSSDIIEQFTRDNNARISMFSVGGGQRANKYLLDLVSYRNRGDAIVVPENEGIPAALLEIGRQLRNPVLSRLTYRFTGMDESEVYPRALTHLYLDRPLVIYGKAPASASKIALQVVGNSGTKQHDLVFQVDLTNALKGPETLRLEWAWQKIYKLIGDYTRERTQSALQAIEAFAARHQINVPYAYSVDAPVRY